MARKPTKRTNVPNAGNEVIPPGATKKAADRPIHVGGGPRHAANDTGAPDEEYGAVDTNDPRAEGTVIDEDVPPNEDEAEAYGGAVGGTPAGGRARGGRTGHGIRPGSTGGHGDHTVGTDPKKPTE